MLFLIFETAILLLYILLFFLTFFYWKMLFFPFLFFLTFLTLTSHIPHMHFYTQCVHFSFNPFSL